MSQEKIKADAARVLDVLTEYGPRIYTFGNGGSASIAEHMACDWMKGTDGRLQVMSLSSNGSLLSAIANDLGYEHTCEAQLSWLVEPLDILVLISSSGNSRNIIAAAEFANDLGLRLIGFTGFDGGGLRKLADVSIHIESEDYGVVEDYHSQVMHEVARQLRRH